MPLWQRGRLGRAIAAGALELTSVTQAKEQMAVDLDAALECAEAATMALQLCCSTKVDRDVVGRDWRGGFNGKSLDMLGIAGR